MSDIKYDWKVDFAVFVSISSFLYTVISSIWLRRSQWKRERIKAYEQVYEDACFVLEYPFHAREATIKSQGYEHSDSEFQCMVRDYLDSHWMSRTYGYSRFVPRQIRDEAKRTEYLDRVRSAAEEYDKSYYSKVLGLGLQERSPVYHMGEESIRSRVETIFQYVGRNLSMFSPTIQRVWEDAKFKEPGEIRKKYEQCLNACKNFFVHNPRDFSDPFLELLEHIRQEYRALARPEKGRLRWKLRRAIARIRRK